MLKKDIKQYVMPIIIFENPVPKVLLIAEKNNELLSLPEIELDSKTTMHDAIANFFKNVVPLNVKVEEVFRVYTDEDDDNRIQVTAFVAGIFADDNPKVDFSKELKFNEKFVDIAIFYDIEKSIDNSQLKGDDCHIQENTGIILAHVYDRLYGEDEEDEPEELLDGPGESQFDDELNKETEDLNKAVEKIAEANPSNESAKFLKKYDDNRKIPSAVKVEIEELDGKTIVEPKVIHIDASEKVVLIFKDVKDMEITIEGNSVIDCLVSKKDKSKTEPPKEP